MQELAEAGAKVLNAQAVEFAKERGIAIYARADARAAPARRSCASFPPRAPGRVVGRRQRDAASCSLEPRRRRATRSRRLLERAGRARRRRASSCCFRQVRRRGGAASLVLSLENLHDFAAPAARAARALRATRVALREGVGAVSAIGAGINAALRQPARAPSPPWPRRWRAQVLGVSTSSFRISLLLADAHVRTPVRRAARRADQAAAWPDAPLARRLVAPLQAMPSRRILATSAWRVTPRRGRARRLPPCCASDARDVLALEGRTAPLQRGVPRGAPRAAARRERCSRAQRPAAAPAPRAGPSRSPARGRCPARRSASATAPAPAAAAGTGRPARAASRRKWRASSSTSSPRSRSGGRRSASSLSRYMRSRAEQARRRRAPRARRWRR